MPKKKVVRIANPISCREELENLADCAGAGLIKYTYILVGAIIFKWLEKHGAMFYKNELGTVFCFVSKNTYELNGRNKVELEKYEKLLLSLSGLIFSNVAEKKAIKTILFMAMNKATEVKNRSWIHSDIDHIAIYYNLNNNKSEIIKITPDGVEVIQNGVNQDKVLLENPSMMDGIEYISDVDTEKADRLFYKLITNKLATTKESAILISNWFSSFLLAGFISTKPLTRFEGNASSGKTMASKLFSTLIYGSPKQQISTQAANYADGSINPFLFLDNVETKQMTDGLINFLLTSSTGIIKKKRKGGTDLETVTERSNCFVNSTGIDPLNGDIAAILSRSFIFYFSNKYHKNSIDEVSSINEIKKYRDYILSGIFKKTAGVLKFISEGAIPKVKDLLRKEFGNHKKKRLNDYIILMYLFSLVDSGEEDIGTMELSYFFTKQIQEQIDRDKNISSTSSQIVSAISALFRTREVAIKNDGILTKQMDNPRYLLEFKERNKVDFFTKEGQIEDVLAKNLYLALLSISRNSSIQFKYKSIQQFIQRFVSEKKILEDAGFIIESNKTRSNQTLYNITNISKEPLEEISKNNDRKYY